MPTTKAITLTRPDGYIISLDRDGRAHEADTFQCAHCGAHVAVIRGSGRRRGWCRPCNGPTCGKAGCDRCEPTEAKLARQSARLQLRKVLDEQLTARRSSP